MAQPNSEHVVSTPAVTGNNYQPDDEGDLGAWCKMYPGTHPGGGWRNTHDIPDANSGSWHQT